MCYEVKTPYELGVLGQGPLRTDSIRMLEEKKKVSPLPESSVRLIEYCCALGFRAGCVCTEKLRA